MAAGASTSMSKRRGLGQQLRQIAVDAGRSQSGPGSSTRPGAPPAPRGTAVGTDGNGDAPHVGVADVQPGIDRARQRQHLVDEGARAPNVTLSIDDV